MPSTELLLPFFVATAIFACVPGPGMFYAAAQTIARGRRAGWHSALGLHLAGYAHVAAAACGLAVLLEAVPVLYAAVKLLGAAYLIWLGVKLFTSRAELAVSPLRMEAKTLPHAVREGITVEVLNPKTALFYLAFLPQFTEVSAALPVWAQVLILGTIVNFVFSFTDVVCVLLSERLTRLLAGSQAARRLTQRIGGGILVALGINLAASRQ
ncbi:MAG: LysE family translocator [Rhodovibrionaceae bacterium]